MCTQNYTLSLLAPCLLWFDAGFEPRTVAIDKLYNWMGKVDRFCNSVEPFAALFWALGSVLANTWTVPASLHRCTRSMSLYGYIVGAILSEDALPPSLFLSLTAAQCPWAAASLEFKLINLLIILTLSLSNHDHVHWMDIDVRTGKLEEGQSYAEKKSS